MDIVQKLRATPASAQIEYPIPEAADEIERLRSVVLDLREQVAAAHETLGREPGVNDSRGNLQRWAAFGAEIMSVARDGELGSVDGDDIQNIGVAAGVLVAVSVAEPCGESCRCAEYGDFPMTCYRRIAVPNLPLKE